MTAYQEHTPLPALRPYVDCLWTRTDNGGGTARVLPDGCVDIIFKFGSTDITSYVVGTMTNPILVHGKAREHYVAVRFRPGGAYPFLRVPLNELTDLRVDLSDVWGHADDLRNELEAGGDIRHRIGILQHHLLRRLTPTSLQNRYVHEAVNILNRTTGQTSIRALEERLGVSRQALARQFRTHVGVSPKTLARILRFQDFTRRVRETKNVQLCLEALESGYCDQAHMTSDFRQFAGLPPAQFFSVS